MDRERAFGAAALLVLVVVLIAGAATAGTDDDCAPGDRPCLLDEQACHEVAAGEAILPFQDSSYTSCRATLAPKRFVWFGDDPIRSITIADYSG